jgi:hypothetical protein
MRGCSTEVSAGLNQVADVVEVDRGANGVQPWEHDGRKEVYRARR